MTPRLSRMLAWTLFGAFVLVTGCWLVLGHRTGELLVENIAFAIAYAAFAVVGLLIASRRPENSIGWIFLGIAIGANSGNAASAYAEYALVTHPGSLPAGKWMAWAGEFLWPTAITSILLLLVLFPSGRPASRFQRWVLWMAITGMATLNIGGFLLKPRRIAVSERVSIENPMGLEALKEPLAILEAMAFLIPVAAFLSIGALFVQARRARGVERQQLKWFGYSALAMVFSNFVLTNVVKALFPWTIDMVGDIFFVVGFALIPLGTGVAILKYRLYDLERIVNRTLVYAGLTAVLATAYLGFIVLFQSVLEPLTQDSDLAVAGSTLLVAAMFRPIRSRIQAFIDHRFYRRKYNAQATLEAFATHLRDEVDLGSLSHKLVATVGGVMHPAHASLWLRSPHANPSEAPR